MTVISIMQPFQNKSCAFNPETNTSDCVAFTLEANNLSFQFASQSSQFYYHFMRI